MNLRVNLHLDFPLCLRFPDRSCLCHFQFHFAQEIPKKIGRAGNSQIRLNIFSRELALVPCN